ncbi:hypothetical protein C8R44DRAFT_756797 [Mycena epipterygia]|nr:hypothetical protein C8R44DRAFT_756797 [Mycena epipterygia]
MLRVPFFEGALEDSHWLSAGSSRTGRTTRARTIASGTVTNDDSRRIVEQLGLGLVSLELESRILKRGLVFFFCLFSKIGTHTPGVIPGQDFERLALMQFEGRDQIAASASASGRHFSFLSLTSHDSEALVAVPTSRRPLHPYDHVTRGIPDTMVLQVPHFWISSHLAAWKQRLSPVAAVPAPALRRARHPPEHRKAPTGTSRQPNLLII